MDRLESRVRDYLAEHLEAIEPGLVLLKKEFKLANGVGAGGSIDILARDRFHHHVVIEIKRSDQAARAALHELTKYVALLKASLGLRQDQLRVLLLSTDWHELAVPFSEYQQVCEVATDGRILEIEPTGVVTCVRPFVPRALEHPLTICRQQLVYLFADAVRRDAAIQLLLAAAKRANLIDFIVLAVDHRGNSGHVIHPHGAWLAFSSPLEGLSADGVAALKGTMPWDHDLMDQDENFLAAVHPDCGHDSLEIGYPEKLAACASRGWQIHVASREGRYAANRSIVPDAALVAEAMRAEGGASYYLDRTVSPQHAPSWEKFRADVDLVLLGNPLWERAVRRVLRETEKSRPRATVSAHLFNPANIPLGLATLVDLGEAGYLPDVQLVVSDESEARLYIGLLVWNGRCLTESSRSWFDKAYGSIDEYLLSYHFHEQWKQDAEACRLLGISSVLLEVRHAGTPGERASVLFSKGGRQHRMPLAKFAMRSVAEFCSANPQFGASLVADLAEVGLFRRE